MDTRRVPYEEVNGDKVLVEVDVCSQCAGLWLDADDGDVRALTRSTLEEETDSPEGTEDEEARPTCPRDESYLDLDFTVKGATLFRCETCHGTFVSRPQAERLAHTNSGEIDLGPALRMMKAKNSRRT